MYNWKHKSILKLIEESHNDDPIKAIRERARNLVLKAFEEGWQGPPYNPIELSEILKLEIIPNDSVTDARTTSPKENHFKIEYNPFQNPNRINFSLAHEIAHTLFSDCEEEVRHREEERTFNWELEFLCNIAASEILLPYASFSNEANSCELKIESLLEISKKYKASLESVFLRFTEVVDKPCGIMIGTFKSENSIEIDYYKPSRNLSLNVNKGYKVPNNSSAYEIKAPGWTAREEENWKIFQSEKFMVYSIGLPPLKRDTKNRIGIFIVPSIYSFDEQKNKIFLENGDATKPRGSGIKIIVQLVNSYGALGMGFGKSLSKNYPIVKQKLEEWKNKKKNFVLGNSQLIEAEDKIYVFQMLAQKGLYEKEGEIPLKYFSLRNCLIELGETAKKLKATIHMPQIGTGQAKGDWNIIQGMLHDELISRDLKVYVYVLPGTVYNAKLKSNLTLFKEESTWQNVR